MKALVTGGTGFIGSHVVDQLLEAGHHVRIFSRGHETPERLRDRDIDVFHGDLKDFGSVADAMKGMDLFYHIGEIKNINKAASAKNIRLMEHIIKNLGASGIKRIVFISSITVAGIPSETPANEDTNPEVVLNDHYTSYKRKCEELLGGANTGFEYAIVRPAYVYGPGSRYLGRLIDILDKIGPFGFPFIGNAGNNTPLVQVKDLAQAIYLSGVQPAASGRIFNLTDGLRHTWLDFFSAITDLLGKKIKIIPVPPFLLRIPAIPVDLFSGFFGIELDLGNYLDYFSRDLYFDNAKAREFLDWQPKYSLTDGIKEMVQYYRGV